MSRPLLNLSIVELIGLFEDSNGKVTVTLDLLKELRHRSTPKANALNKRVMAVIALNASYAVLQSLQVPELEALVIECDDKPILRASLIKVLKTRGSVKAQRLLEQLSNTTVKSEIEKVSEPAIGAEKSELQAAPNASNPTIVPSIQKPLMFTKPAQPTVILSQPVRSISSIPTNVEQAFSLFELSTTASWMEIEAARQRCVTKYRPGAGFDKATVNSALKQISEAHSALADYMKNKN